MYLLGMRFCSRVSSFQLFFCSFCWIYPIFYCHLHAYFADFINLLFIYFKILLHLLLLNWHDVKLIYQFTILYSAAILLLIGTFNNFFQFVLWNFTVLSLFWRHLISNVISSWVLLRVFELLEIHQNFFSKVHTREP